MTTFESKYAPQSLGDIIFPNIVTGMRLLDFAANQNHKSMIFYGPHGTAKSTTAKLLAANRASAPNINNAAYFHAADFSGANYNKIVNQQIWDRLGSIEFPVTIIDEFDQMHVDKQKHIRKLVDETKDKASYILITNHLSQIDSGLRDRLQRIEFPAVPPEDFLERARWILEQEDVSMPDQTILRLLKTCDGSVRKMIDVLEDAVLMNRHAA